MSLDPLARQHMAKLTMLLAQGPDNPDGDLTNRLDVWLALTTQGQIDIGAYNSDPMPWLATHQHAGREPVQCELIRLDEGWVLQKMQGEDDPLWTFEGHVFRPGELVRLGHPDGRELLFRIVAVQSD